MTHSGERKSHLAFLWTFCRQKAVVQTDSVSGSGKKMFELVYEQMRYGQRKMWGKRENGDCTLKTKKMEIIKCLNGKRYSACIKPNTFQMFLVYFGRNFPCLPSYPFKWDYATLFSNFWFETLSFWGLKRCYCQMFSRGLLSVQWFRILHKPWHKRVFFPT